MLSPSIARRLPNSPLHPYLSMRDYTPPPRTPKSRVRSVSFSRPFLFLLEQFRLIYLLLRTYFLKYYDDDKQSATEHGREWEMNQPGPERWETASCGFYCLPVVSILLGRRVPIKSGAQVLRGHPPAHGKKVTTFIRVQVGIEVGVTRGCGCGSQCMYHPFTRTLGQGERWSPRQLNLVSPVYRVWKWKF